MLVNYVIVIVRAIVPEQVSWARYLLHVNPPVEIVEPGPGAVWGRAEALAPL
jgi:hypothetical protein